MVLALYVYQVFIWPGIVSRPFLIVSRMQRFPALKVVPGRWAAATESTRPVERLTEASDAGENADELNIPQGTLNAWKRRYLKDDELEERIDAFIETEVVEKSRRNEELYYQYNETECDGFVYWNMACLPFLIAISITWAFVLWAPKQRTSSLFRES